MTPQNMFSTQSQACTLAATPNHVFMQILERRPKALLKRFQWMQVRRAGRPAFHKYSTYICGFGLMHHSGSLAGKVAPFVVSVHPSHRPPTSTINPFTPSRPSSVICRICATLHPFWRCGRALCWPDARRPCSCPPVASPSAIGYLMLADTTSVMADRGRMYVFHMNPSINMR
ncbi:MAG: hypothetical protein LQ341_003266 [Variospora aurantia]|nr:MAG: hypothetical protein LQ341_003266 [Variospora aurantia]